MCKLKSLLTLVCVLSLTTACKDQASVSAQNGLDLDTPVEVDQEIVDTPIIEENQDESVIVLPDETHDSEDSDDEIMSDEEVSDQNDTEMDQVVDDSNSNEDSDGDSDQSYDQPVVDESIQCKKRGNLIENGSFELVDDRKGLVHSKALNSIEQSGWDVFNTLPSKDSEKPSWYTVDGAGIEVQGYKTVVGAPHGFRSVELDSHQHSDLTNTNTKMAQDVYLCPGKYKLKFSYYPRTKKENDNKIVVSINNVVLKSVNKVHDGKWHLIRKSFKVDKAGVYTLSFSAKGVENSLGGLIDRVGLHKKKRRAGVVTNLVALGDQDNLNEPMIHKEISKSIINKLVNFASKVKRPKILIVRDDGHNGEQNEEFSFVQSILEEKYEVKAIDGELRMADVDGFDLVYVINPGHPLRRAGTRDTIESLIEEQKIGVVLSGDDIARGRGFNMQSVTRAKYLNNGTKACGVRVDNNKGSSYMVKLKKRFFSRLTKNERVLKYGNDIDHVKVEKGVRILSFAKFSKDECKLKTPAIFGYKYKK